MRTTFIQKLLFILPIFFGKQIYANNIYKIIERTIRIQQVVNVVHPQETISTLCKGIISTLCKGIISTLCKYPFRYAILSVIDITLIAYHDWLKNKKGPFVIIVPKVNQLKDKIYGYATSKKFTK